MKLLIALVVLLASLGAGFAATVYPASTNGNNVFTGLNTFIQPIKAPPVFPVTAFGAKGDGTTDDVVAFRTALTNGSIVVPFSATPYIIGGEIYVPSNRRIICEPGVVIKRKAANYEGTVANFLRNADYTGGNTNIFIQGGIWDGNVANMGPRVTGAPFVSGVGFRFLNVKGLVIRDITLQYNQCFYLQLGLLNDFAFDNIVMNYDGVCRANADGIHFNGGCSNGVVRNVHSNGGYDDQIAINADDVSYFDMVNGDIQNVIVDGVENDAAHTTGVRLLSGPHSIKNVQIRNVRGKYAFGRCVTVGSEGTGAGGVIEGVTFSDWDIEMPQINQSFLWWDTCIAKNFYLNNIRVKFGIAAQVADCVGGIGGKGQHLFLMNSGAITNLVMTGIDVQGYPTNSSLVSLVNGMVKQLSVNGFYVTTGNNAIPGDVFLLGNDVGFANLLNGYIDATVKVYNTNNALTQIVTNNIFLLQTPTGAVYTPGSTANVTTTNVLPTTLISVFGWVKLSATTVNQALFTSCDNALASGFLFQYHNGAGAGYQSYVNTAGGLSVASTGMGSLIGAGVWGHLGFTYDGNTNRLYVNGTMVVEDHSKSGNMTHNNPMVLASPTVGGNYAVGAYDEFAVWNRVLSQAEINTLYNSGAGVAGDTNSAPWNSGLVEGYHFNETSGAVCVDFAHPGGVATASGTCYRVAGKIP